MTLTVEIEHVTAGEGYVARVGGRAVIVQPTWERLVDALVEYLRGLA